MESHSITTSPFACCPNLSGGTPEFMESMTFWLDSLSTAVVVIAIVVAVTTIIVTIASVVIGFLGLTRIKAVEDTASIAAKTAENVAKAIMFEKQFVKQVVGQEFHNKPASNKQPQDREEQNDE